MKVKNKAGKFEKSRVGLLLEALNAPLIGGAVENAHGRIDKLAIVMCNILARDGVGDDEFLEIIESSYAVADK